MDLNHDTGGSVEGWAHVQQSLATILTTNKASRVFLREFGSDLSDLVDAPMNETMVLAAYVAIAEAIADWEPRFEITEIGVETLATGVIALSLTGNYRPNAHLGDLSTAEGDTRHVRVVSDRAESWSVAA